MTTRFPVLEAVLAAYQQEKTGEREVYVTVSVMTTIARNTHLFHLCSALTTFSHSPHPAVTGVLPVRMVPLYLPSGFRALHPEFVRVSLTRCSGG